MTFKYLTPLTILRHPNVAFVIFQSTSDMKFLVEGKHIYVHKAILKIRYCMYWYCVNIL